MPARRALALALMGSWLAATGCGGRYGAPRALAASGAGLVAGGAGLWVGGERQDRDALTNAGLATVVVGVAAVIVAGGWMAVRASCRTDADCQESEACREVPAPPGGVPYSQCVAR